MAQNVYRYEKEKLPQPIFEGREDWIDLYYKAWEIAFDNVDYVNKEGWKPILTCMPGVGVTWQWDSCFMTFITNYSNGTFSAFNNLDNLYRLRDKESGYISMAYRIDTEQPAYGERINPPLYAWVEWEHYLISGDSSRFEQILPAVEGLYGFIENNRRRGDGLYYFEDPGSSGMDNAPRGGYPAYDLKGSDVCYIDLACQQSLTAKCIAKMYEVLGNTEKAEFYKAENERINALINQYHWHPQTGYYYDFFSRNAPITGKRNPKHKLINTKTAAAFWTLLCGAAEGERKVPMVEHLMNPKEFFGHSPFASLSMDDLNYDPTGGYWLGSNWHPTTFAAIRGLHEKGYFEYAREAAIKYVDSMCDVFKDPAYGGIWECYNPERSRPATRENGEFCMPNFVGWGGLGPITVLIENIIGLHFNAAENSVLFEVCPDRKSGLKNMLFNGGKVDIECVKYGRKHGETQIKVVAEKPFTLTVLLARGRKKTFEIAAGESTVEI